MRVLSIVGMSCLLGLAACASDKPKVVEVNDNPSPYAQGKTHTEPLFYNGRTYRVTFRHVIAEKVYDVQVLSPGRTLGTTSGDQRVVSEVGRNAINHFACQDTRKARIVPGSAQPAGQGWTMRARCV